MPQRLTSLGSLVVFDAWQPATGDEPWVTDGTAAGTMPLGDLTPGYVGGLQGGFVVAGGVAFFAARTPTTGVELWKTDGTPGNTVLVRDLNPSGDSDPDLLGDFGGRLLFTAEAVAGRRDLLLSDGTAAGTVTVAVASGSEFTTATPGASLGSVYLFSAGGAAGQEPWRTDGTAAGTYAVKDIWPGSNGSNPGSFAALGSQVLFRADDPVAGSELWTSDGTSGGTARVVDLYPSPLTAGSALEVLGRLGEQAFLRATDAAVPASQLWTSDGTAAGTTKVVDFSPGAGPYYPFVALDSWAFFAADDGVHGSEPWVTDGTSAGTKLLVDFAPGPSGSSPQSYFAWQGTLYFAASGAYGLELHATDGTAAGTRLVRDIHPGPASGLMSPKFTGFGNAVYFAADDGSSGTELWRSDGTATGTFRVIDLHPTGSSYPFGMIVLGSRLVFAAYDAAGMALWSTDGTAAGTQLVYRSKTYIVDTLQRVDDATAVFRQSDVITATELWRTDGTAAGTFAVATLEPALTFVRQAPYAHPGATTSVFAADDGVHGDEPWISDGTAAGTHLLADIGSISSYPAGFLRVRNRIVLAADDGVHGQELFAIDMVATGDYAVDPYGSGCPGTGGAVPTIGLTGAPTRTTPFTFELANARPSAAAALLIGFRQGRQPLGGGCTLWVATPFVAVPAITDATGRSSLQVPPQPLIAGLQIDSQWVVADPMGAYLGLAATSNGLELIGAP